MPEYSHPCSPKKFTQHQLFACLVLKEFFKLDYRGVEALLVDSDSLRAIIDLRVAPRTLRRCTKPAGDCCDCRFATSYWTRPSRWRNGRPCCNRPLRVAAVDASGFEAHRASNYFVRRRAPYGKQTGKWQVTTYRRFPKLAVVCDCSSHLILAAVPGCGPKPDDGHWSRAMAEARRRVRMKLLLCDAGYDAEWIHWAARLAFQTRTIIPPTRGRPTKKLPRQYYRRKMARLFKQRRKRRPYRQRCQAETVFSVLKRRLDASVNACSYWSQCRALMLKAITHNIMILRQKQVFDRAFHGPYNSWPARGRSTRTPDPVISLCTIRRLRTIGEYAVGMTIKKPREIHCPAAARIVGRLLGLSTSVVAAIVCGRWHVQVIIDRNRSWIGSMLWARVPAWMLAWLYRFYAPR